MKWKQWSLIALLISGLLSFSYLVFKNKNKQNLDLKELSRYAISFNIDYQDEGQCGELPKLNNNLKSILRSHKKTLLFKRNIALIILKYYNCDMNNYRVGEELETHLFFQHPIVEAYYETLRDLGRTNFEFVPSSDVFDIINHDPKLLSDKFIVDTLQETCNIFKTKDLLKDLPFDMGICKFL